jgi:hypothetical protein
MACVRAARADIRAVTHVRAPRVGIAPRAMTQM